MKFKPLIQNHDHNKFINSRSDAKAPEIQYTIGIGQKKYIKMENSFSENHD